MSSFCVDANIFLTAWYVNYPISIFPSLWEQIAEQNDEIILLKPIFDEIEPMTSNDKKISLQEKENKFPVRMWLINNDFSETEIDNAVNSESLNLEMEYQISSISKGAGQKDVTLIAYSKLMNKTVVTLESFQVQKPGKKSNYKIPLICKEQNVECINFIQMISRLGIKI